MRGDGNRLGNTFRVTVDHDFWTAVTAACGAPFAESYLYGAYLASGELTPRTVTGWSLMRENRDFTDLLGKLKIRLKKPEPFHLSGNIHNAADPY